MTERSITKHIAGYGVVCLFTPVTAIFGILMLLDSLVRLVTKERWLGPKIFSNLVVSSVAYDPTIPTP